MWEWAGVLKSTPRSFMRFTLFFGFAEILFDKLPKLSEWSILNRFVRRSVCIIGFVSIVHSKYEVIVNEGAEEVHSHEHCRTYRGVCGTPIDQPEVDFLDGIGPVARNLAAPSVGSTSRARRRSGSDIYSADSSRVATVGGADRALSRFSGCSNSGSVQDRKSVV